MATKGKPLGRANRQGRKWGTGQLVKLPFAHNFIRHNAVCQVAALYSQALARERYNSLHGNLGLARKHGLVAAYLSQFVGEAA